MLRPPGATRVSVDVQFLDDLGRIVTGKVAADFPACKWSNGDNTADTAIALSDLALITTPHPNNNVAGGIKEREGGFYRLDLPNNMFITVGSKKLTFAETTDKRIVVEPIECQYPQVDIEQVGGSGGIFSTTPGLLAVQVNGYLLGQAPNQLILVDPNTPFDSVKANTLSGDYQGGLLNCSLAGKVLGSGVAVIVGVGSWVLDGAGAAVGTLANQTTLLARLTAARAGYLDNLNVGGAVASHADIDAINQSASRRIVITTLQQYERPEAGTTLYTIEVRTYDGDGAAVNADSAPTLTALGSISGNLSGNLSASSNPATGVYRWDYTVALAAAQEQIRFDVSATLSAQTFTLACYAQVTDLVSATWTTTDASHLTAVFNKLPAGNMTDAASYTAARAAKLDNLDAPITGIAAAVWAAGSRTLTSFGTLIADFWAGITVAAANFIADHVRRRKQVNVEASANGDALDLKSQYGAIQQMQKSSVAVGGNLNVKKTDGTPLGTLVLTEDAASNPVVGVN